MRISIVFLLVLIFMFYLTVAFAAQISAEIAGPQEVVFDTATQACEPTDIPDSNSRAFRDSNNQVHLFASHFYWRAMVGPTLDDVKRDCRMVYKSAEDSDPSHFKDFNWAGSFFTLDGNRIVALTHDEYHGWAYPGMCLLDPKQNASGHCWWNTIGFAKSADGGWTFDSPNPPKNLIASLPIPYDPKTLNGATGYYEPTNIVQSGKYYYAMINAWSNQLQRHGACLIRTNDVFDARSWQAWDGSEFDVKFIDPFLQPAGAGEHICAPVYLGTAQSLVSYAKFNCYLLTEFASDNRYGVPGLYIAQSSDLIHWSKPSLVISQDELKMEGGLARSRFDYFSLLDPQSTDRDFSTVTDRPYVYYVEFDLDHAPLKRKLIRQKLLLTNYSLK